MSRILAQVSTLHLGQTYLTLDIYVLRVGMQFSLYENSYEYNRFHHDKYDCTMNIVSLKLYSRCLIGYVSFGFRKLFRAIKTITMMNQTWFT